MSGPMPSDAEDKSPRTLDEQLKVLQIRKTEAEFQRIQRELGGFNLTIDNATKLIVSVLAIATAGFAVYTGIPQTKLDLHNTQQNLSKAQQELANKKSEVSEIEKTRESLNSELKKLQLTLASLKNSTQASGGGAISASLQERIAAGAEPLVYIQFAGALNRDDFIEPLRVALKNEGFNVPRAERINRGQTNEVRYFSRDQGEVETAQRVKEIVQKTFQSLNCPLPGINVRFVALPEGRKSPVELWLMHSCGG